MFMSYGFNEMGLTNVDIIYLLLILTPLVTLTYDTNN